MPSGPGSTPTARRAAAARACAAPQLRGEDIVEHFFTTTTHHWLLFFTNLGRVYRAKAYELPERSRDAKGQHVANLLAFQPGEQIAQVLAIRDYDAAPYLVLATRAGLVKKTRRREYDSPRSGGLIAINLRDGRRAASVPACALRRTTTCCSCRARASRCGSTRPTTPLRPMGRATSGVTGMKFRDGDDLLSMSCVEDGEDPDVFVVFENGLAKRTPVVEYRVKGRGGLGIKVAKLSEQGRRPGRRPDRGRDDEVLVVMEKGKIVRSAGRRGAPTGRNTQGVQVRRARQGRHDRRGRPQRRAAAEAELEDVVERPVGARRWRRTRRRAGERRRTGYVRPIRRRRRRRPAADDRAATGRYA